jgi:predicted TIM-barrel fold metal-dependent hydrolase
MHLFGPFDRYPLSSRRSYTPPEASVAMYRAVCAAIGIQRTVVVQPSVYGTDNALTLDSVAALGRDRARAVVVVDEAVTRADLEAMASRGACGVRFNAVLGNGPPLEQLPRLADRLRPMGWHLELYCHAHDIVPLEPIVPVLGVPVVFDHMGGIRAGEASGPAFAALIRLLGGGAWVKLCGYRSSGGHPYDDVKAMARAMIAAAPSRCVWGTDWPHPALDTEVPDDGHLMNLLSDWAPDPAQRQAILVENPKRLYAF